MSFVQFLTEEAIVLESTKLLIEAQVLEEKINSFADLPNAWKKKLGNQYEPNKGENSAVETITYKAKGESQLNKAVTDAFKKSDEETFAIIQFHDEPFMLLYNDGIDGGKKFRFYTVDGSTLKYREYVRGRQGSYFADSDTFKTNEAKQRIKEEIIKFAKARLENADELSDAQIFDSLDISVVVVKNDKSRIEKRAERREAKYAVDSLTSNKRKVIKKFTTNVVQKIIDDINNSIININDADKIINDIIAGKAINIESSFDAKSVADKIYGLRKILKEFKTAYDGGRIMDPKWYKEKADADYYIEYLLSSIKKYEAEYNKAE